MVSPEFFAAIESMLNKGRRHFGSAGASLTHHVLNPHYKSGMGFRAVTAGLDGEKKTSATIRGWMELHPEVVLVDSCHIQGLDASDEVDDDTGLPEGPDTDHVLIIGDTVILVDSKRWKGRRSYSISDKGKVLRQKKYFPAGSRVHAKQARYLWKKYLGVSSVTSVVCIAQEKVFVVRDRNWYKAGFRLISGENLVAELNELYSKVEDKRINPALVAEVVACAVKPFKLDEALGMSFMGFR